jgi:phospholipase/carboxylesterase
VIWLHGLGADGSDFVPIVPALRLRAPVRFVFPHASRRPVTVNGGMMMRAWYDVLALEGAWREDETGIRESARRVESLIAAEGVRGVPPARVILAGFSQGGVMALHVGLRHAARLGGLLVLSAYLPLAHAIAEQASPAGRATSVFLAHGTQDPLMSVTRARTPAIASPPSVVPWSITSTRSATRCPTRRFGISPPGSPGVSRAGDLGWFLELRNRTRAVLVHIAPEGPRPPPSPSSGLAAPSSARSRAGPSLAGTPAPSS